MNVLKGGPINTHSHQNLVSKDCRSRRYTQRMSFLRICPSEQRVFHHLVRQLRKPDIKLIHSLVSCRYRGEEIWQRNIQLSIPIHHPACLRIDTLICLFPSVLVLIMAIYSRAVTWTMCYSEHTFVGFFFKVQFISETRVNATSFCLNHRSMTSTCKFQVSNCNTCEISIFKFFI